MKIAIIGSGAIGLYYGACLQRIGEDVRFLMRSDYQTAKSRGIRITTPGGRIHLKEVKAYLDPQSIGVCDLVIIALKTTSSCAVEELVRPVISKQSAILTLQNGIGNDEALGALFPENRILSGLCFICLNRVAPATVENYHLGTLSIGSYRDEGHLMGQRVAGLFQRSGVETRFEDDLALIQWKKLVWNIPFNGLTIAAGGVPTDQVLASEELLAETRALMEEVIQGAAALGMNIRSSFVDDQVNRTYEMGAYKPSSMIDYLEGRSVEVEAIWGEPLRRAKAAGAKLPRLETLYQELKRRCK